MPLQLLAVKLPGVGEHVPKALSAIVSPGHPEPSPLGVHPIAEPSGSKYIKSLEMVPPLPASATNRFPCASTAMPVGALRVASLVLPQLFD
jgi:hypothetical protein